MPPPTSVSFASPVLPCKRPRVRKRASVCATVPSGLPSDQPSRPDKALQRKVESHLLASEQQSDLLPTTPPHPPAALPVQLDLLNYHARVASRRRSTRPTAERLYKRCIALNSSDGRAWLGLARLRLASGDVYAARHTFRAAVRASRGNAHLLQAWGVLEQRQGNPARAKGLFDAAVRTDPSHCAAWVALGLWHRRYANDVSEARISFRTGAEADPGNYYVWHVWGMLERDCKRFSVARECFRRGVEANPNNAATYVAWGALEDAVGNYTDAVKLFDKAHIANPRNTHAYVSHAVAAERAGDIGGAVSLLETAVEIRPNDPAPRQTLGLVAWRTGDFDTARAQFQAALDTDPKHVPTWHAWACVERKLGLLDRARELFQEAVWADPRSPHVVRTWHSWAMLELTERNFDAARRYFGHGLEVDPSSVPLLSGLAKLEAIEKNMPRARECMEKCIRLYPSLRTTWKEYEKLERQFGSVQRAQLVYERCVVISQQVDKRLIVSEPLPGDYAAGGMWIDPLELKPNESAFERVKDSTRIVPEALRPERGAQEDSNVEDGSTSMGPKISMTRRSGRPKSTGQPKRRRPLPPVSDPSFGPKVIADLVPKPAFPPNMPFLPTTP